MKREKIVKYIMLILTLCVNIFIIVNGFIKGVESSEISNGTADAFLPMINEITGDAIKTEPQVTAYHSVFRKLIGHFGLFGLNGILSTITIFLFTKNTPVKNHLFLMLFSFAFGFVVAGISELAQISTDGRTAAWSDVGIDSAGYFIGMIFVVFCIFLTKEKIFKFEQKKQA